MDINSNGKIITLNSDQENALVKGRQFLQSRGRNNLFFRLSGSAGTGKSTILKEIIKGCEIDTTITAPTHKAKSVIANMTGLQSVTIHSLLGLQPNLDLETFDAKKLEFHRLGDNKMIGRFLICVDESSMLNIPLLKMMKDAAYDNNVKIMFIGDINQLAPIKEEFSPVFYDSDIPFAHLSKVERQKDSNPLMNIYADIISDINSEKDLFKHESCFNSDKNEGVIFEKSRSEFGKKILEEFSSYDYIANKDHCKILCFQNDTVRRWNNYVRNEFYGGFSSELKDGEILMSYTNKFSNLTGITEIQNSQDYIIADIQNSKKQGITGKLCILQNLDTAQNTSVFIMDKSIDNNNIFVPQEQKLYNRAKDCKDGNRKFYWKQYYEYRNKFMLLEDIKDERGAIIVGKDFDFSYAMTVHKSQGSTYTNVFIDELDIDYVNKLHTKENPTHSFRNRLKYVAFTRPTNIAYVNY